MRPQAAVRRQAEQAPAVQRQAEPRRAQRPPAVQRRAEQARAEQARAEQARAEQARAEQAAGAVLARMSSLLLRRGRRLRRLRLRLAGRMPPRCWPARILFCNEAATAPDSLAPRGRYVAWLSSAQADARDRLKAAAGGTMPRGWVRIDGKPFLDQLPTSAAFEPDVRYPVGLTETGTEASEDVTTATDIHGAYIPAWGCDNWNDRTSLSADIHGAMAGLPYAGASAWTNREIGFCGGTHGLYCMQVDHVTPLPPPPVPTNAKRIFLARFNQPASGISAADARCVADATAAGLPGVFRALLALRGASAASRFHPDGVRPFVRLDGVVVAEHDVDLFTPGKGPAAPICIDAFGRSTSGTAFTGTANLSQTEAVAYNCADWTLGTMTSLSYVTFADLSGPRSFGSTVSPCTYGDSIFCVED